MDLQNDLHKPRGLLGILYFIAHTSTYLNHNHISNLHVRLDDSKKSNYRGNKRSYFLQHIHVSPCIASLGHCHKREEEEEDREQSLAHGLVDLRDRTLTTPQITFN